MVITKKIALAFITFALHHASKEKEFQMNPISLRVYSVKKIEEAYSHIFIHIPQYGSRNLSICFFYLEEKIINVLHPKRTKIMVKKYSNYCET